MGPLDLVNLTPLMERTSGRAEIKVGLIDGPVAMDHPDLAKLIMRCGRNRSIGLPPNQQEIDDDDYFRPNVER
jgi:hypothetical protein